MRAALAGAATGAAFGWVGNFGLEGWDKIGAHALAGGITSEATGGSFRSGFLGAGFAAFAGPYIKRVPSVAGRITAAAVAGGVGARLGGGEFANGAATAAFARLFNHELHGRPRHVHAVKGGRVFRAGWQHATDHSSGLGWRVSIQHTDSTYANYGHMDPATIVDAGSTVATGAVVGDYADPTNGASTGPHVHYELRDPTGAILNPGNARPIPGGVVTSDFGEIDPSHPNGHQGIDMIAR